MSMSSRNSAESRQLCLLTVLLLTATFAHLILTVPFIVFYIGVKYAIITPGIVGLEFCAKNWGAGILLKNSKGNILNKKIHG